MLAWIILIHLRRGELPEPEDHGQRRQDSPGAGGVRADRGRAQLRAGRRAVRGARRVDHPDDLRLLPPAPEAADDGRPDAAPPSIDAATCGRNLRLQRRDGRAAVGAHDQRGAIGDVVPAGARGDVAVRLDDDGAQRLVRDAAAVALRVAAVVGGVADGAVGDALDVRGSASDTRSRWRRSSGRWSRPARSSATASRPTPAGDRRTPGCCAARRAPRSAAASADRGCRRRAGRRGTGGRSARSASGRGCCGAGTTGVLSRTRSRTPSNAVCADVADRTEQPRPEAERIGVLGAHARVGLASAVPSRRSARARRGRRAPRRACRARDRRDRPRWSRRAGACAAARRRPARSPGRSRRSTRAAASRSCE